MRKGSLKRLTKGLMVHTALLLLTIPIVFMLFWFVQTSSYSAATRAFTPQNWSFLYSDAGESGIPLVWPVLGFTVLFGAIVAAVQLVVILPAAYAISRLDFRGKTLMLRALILLQAFPSVVVMIAVFFILTYIKLIDSLAGVVLVCVVNMAPMNAYILKGFFDAVPWDIEQASMVDGCSRFESFYKVVLPAVVPGILTVSVFAFMSAYGEWFLFRVLIFSGKYATMARLFSSLIIEGQYNFGAMAAFGVFYTLPIALFYILTQKSLLKMTVIGGKNYI